MRFFKLRSIASTGSRQYSEVHATARNPQSINANPHLNNAALDPLRR